MSLPKVMESKPFSVGILLAAVFLAVNTVVPFYVSYETLVLAFAVCVFVVCSALIDTLREGLMCGLIVLVAQNIGAFVQVAIRDGLGIAVATVPYPLILTSSYIIAGVLGGYIGGRLAGGRARTKGGRSTTR
jgi:hypothetical protein